MVGRQGWVAADDISDLLLVAPVDVGGGGGGGGTLVVAGGNGLSFFIFNLF